MFALLTAVALGVGGGVTMWRARSQDGAIPTVFLAMIWAVALGVVVGRVFYVLNPPPSVVVYYSRSWYATHLLDLQIGPLAFWSGGLGSGGIAVGAMIAVGVVAWRLCLDITQWADWLIVGLMSGLAIAPLGNFLSGSMFGPPTGMPWGMVLAERISPYDDLAHYPSSMRFQPTPVYFVLLALVVLGSLLVVERRRKEHRPAGILFSLGWGAYCSGAFLLGFLQSDVSRGFLNLSGLQGIMFVMAVASLGVLVLHLTGVRVQDGWGRNR